MTLRLAHRGDHTTRRGKGAQIEDTLAALVAAAQRPDCDGVELTMATNYFGPMLLSVLMLDKLRQSAPSRIVNVSSRSIFGFSGMNGPARWDWDNLNSEKEHVSVEAYKRSKLALTWLTVEKSKPAQFHPYWFVKSATRFVSCQMLSYAQMTGRLELATSSRKAVGSGSS